MENHVDILKNELVGDSTQTLVVKAGTTLSIFPRTYQFKSIVIEKGATLTVYPNSRQWLILMCSGDFVLEGSLVYEGFLRTEDEVAAVAPDGVSLKHKFANLSKSGDGGHGGNFNAQGGIGAPGSPEYGGGGGGSGAYRYGNQYRAGQNADGIYGAKATGAGGDGGAFSRFCNGGLIYLSVSGRLVGDGLIRVNGTDGKKGLDGEAGWARPGGYGVGGGGGGGGGGGAAGGDGGRIVIKAATIEGMPVFSAAFGKGGSGGNANAGGNAGRPGQDGISGLIDQI